MECPTCKIGMIRKKSKFADTFWWGCPNFPKCTVTASEHPNGAIMSYPADKETKALRTKAHEMCDIVFEGDKQAMYNFLKENTKSQHIGHMYRDELERLIEQLDEGTGGEVIL